MDESRTVSFDPPSDPRATSVEQLQDLGAGTLRISPPGRCTLQQGREHDRQLGHGRLTAVKTVRP